MGDTRKFNVALTSALVILLGTIIYPILMESAGRKMAVIENSTPVFVPVETAPEVKEPVVQEKPKFPRDLKVGDKGEDVKLLQEYLNARGFTIAVSGPGSPGHETTLFGNGTAEALKKFQEKYADILLKPYGLSAGTGVFNSATRDFINS